MTNIDIFSQDLSQQGTWFKFIEIGDAIQGTFISKREQPGKFGVQVVYVLKTKDGVVNVPFAVTSKVVHDRMAQAQYGNIVGFRYESNRPSKFNPNTLAKIIKVYLDPAIVDEAWVAEQRGVTSGSPAPINNEAAFIQSLPPTQAAAPVADDEDIPFDVPTDANNGFGPDPFADTPKATTAPSTASAPTAVDLLGEARKIMVTKGYTDGSNTALTDLLLKTHCNVDPADTSKHLDLYMAAMKLPNK